jgi:tetratricopeptide (TPR) repeat protein
MLFRDHLEDPSSALEAFEGAVAERPDDVPGRLSAASLARTAGRLERAAAHLQAAAVLDPGNVQVFHDLFDTFQKLRRVDQAWSAASVSVYLGAAETRERFIFEEHRPAGLVQPARGRGAFPSSIRPRDPTRSGTRRAWCACSRGRAGASASPRRRSTSARTRRSRSPR